MLQRAPLYRFSFELDLFQAAGQCTAKDFAPEFRYPYVSQLPLSRKGQSVPKDRKDLRVLIVDDEHMIASTLAQILNASGFEAKAVFSGEHALPTAAEFQPDVLLT